MLKKFESGLNKEKILDLLNTPSNNEDIISACDKLIYSLEHAVQNAYEVASILEEMKLMKK